MHAADRAARVATQGCRSAFSPLGAGRLSTGAAAERGRWAALMSLIATTRPLA
jgi:hypothetical protein